jgi:hypothetical protein
LRGDDEIIAESFEPEDIGLAAEPCELALGAKQRRSAQVKCGRFGRDPICGSNKKSEPR